MDISDIPHSPEYVRKTCSMADLLDRARGSERVSWTDLPERAGIYVVYFRLNQALHFLPTAGKAISADVADCSLLRSKWAFICQRSPTDIVYIGKGTDLRKRVRILIRFGLGKSANHHGGEWMWQIQEIATAMLLLQTCPVDKAVAFESWMLDRFLEAHGQFPLANRKGPEGLERWHPQ